jgi:glycerophosphoryl diester phosphodiesterase
MLVSAHRGGSEGVDEGTLAAYLSAIELGADLLEVDVRRVGGELVCAHDPGGDGPRLADVLRAAAAGGVGAHVDVKESGYEAELVSFVGSFGLPRAYYTTGDAAAVDALAAAGGTALLTIGRGLAGVGPVEVARRLAGDLWPYARLRGRDGAAVHFRFVNPVLRRWMRRRRMVLLVYTVDGGASLWWLLRRPGVTVVVTDRPGRALALRPVAG